jgi:cobalamin synthase
VQFVILTKTVDLFEVLWQIAFLVAFVCSAVNLRSCYHYHGSALRAGLPRPLVISRKDLRTAWTLLLVSFPGLAVGTLALLSSTTLTNPNTPRDLLVFSVLLRLAFVSIGAGIAALAVWEFRFRRQVATWRLVPTVAVPQGAPSLAREGGPR